MNLSFESNGYPISMSHLTPVHIVDKNGKATTVRRRLSQLFTSKQGIPSPPEPSPAPKPVTPLSLPVPLTPAESSAWLENIDFDPDFQFGLRTTRSSIAALELETQSLLKELMEDRGLPIREAMRLMNAINTVVPLNRIHEMTHDIMLITGELKSQGRLVDQNNYAGMLISLNRVSLNLAGKSKPQRISNHEELIAKTVLTHAFTSWRSGSMSDSVNYKLNSQVLTSFLLEHPEELDRLLSYADERGLNNDGDFGGFLESREVEENAIHGGWL